MQFTVTDQTGPTPFYIAQAPNPFNPTLADSFPSLPTATKQRILTLFEVTAADSNMVEALLDGQMWDAPVSELPELGTTEEWRIINPTMDPHPIHLHLVQFQVVKREIFDSTRYMDDWKALNGAAPFSHPTKNIDLNSYLSNLQVPIQPNEQCWKDTINVDATEVVTIRVRFTQQDGSIFPFDATSGPGYVWHCHLLEHEDNEMMRPYKVVSQGSSIVLPLAVSVVGVAAAASVIGYAYQRKRKKKRQAGAASLNQANSSGDDIEMRSEQIESEKEST
jgi:hypothetical protein